MDLILNTILALAVLFSLLGLFFNTRNPLGNNRELVKEIARLKNELRKVNEEYKLLQLSLERERYTRRSVEDYYQKCKADLISRGVTDIDEYDYREKLIPEKTRSYLADTLCVYFSLEEISVLAFNLGIPYDSINHPTIKVAAMELVLYAERRGLIKELAEQMDKERPQLNVINRIK